VTLKGFYAFTRTEDRATGKQLLRRPRHSGGGSISYRRSSFDVLLSASRVGARLDNDFGGPHGEYFNPAYTRLDAVVTYRVADARTAVSKVDDVRQALYREAQLALRAVVGARELDTFLMEKDGVASELADMVRARAKTLGVELIAVGIRDIILPGEMKDLMNKVTEAKKAAEANLIARREETAAMRNQANTARLLADNPTLMRLRELEVLEKVAASTKMNVVLGEKGLADRVVNLL
jgi:regulator of protease activity HflC (stomatin/prohibitin superfamily)